MIAIFYFVDWTKDCYETNLETDEYNYMRGSNIFDSIAHNVLDT